MYRTCSTHGGNEKWVHNAKLESLKGRDHPEDLGVDGRITLKYNLGKLVWWLWNIFIRLMTGTGGGLLWTL
jgi:hypothetical protein